MAPVFIRFFTKEAEALKGGDADQCKRTFILVGSFCIVVPLAHPALASVTDILISYCLVNLGHCEID